MIRWIIFCLLLSSCKYFEILAPEVSNFNERNMKSSVLNPEVPSALWEKVEKAYEAAGIDEYSEQLDRKKAKISPPKKVFDVKVRLVEKTRGSLDGSNYLLDLGASGNFIDLANFTADEVSGSFFMKIELNPKPFGEEGNLPGFQVFHLSNSKKLKIDGKISGGGCSEYRDITSYFTSEMKKGGFLVSTKNARHISLLAGTFVFVAVESETLYFNSLSVTDSRYLKFLCRK